MTDLVSQLVGALKRLVATGGAMAEATDADLQQAIDDPHADEIVQDQAAAVLQARAALTAAKAGGWVAVPVEPTPEMLKAGLTALFDRKLPPAPWEDCIAETYAAMLAARPTTPPKEQA